MILKSNVSIGSPCKNVQNHLWVESCSNNRLRPNSLELPIEALVLSLPILSQAKDRNITCSEWLSRQ